VPVAIGDYLMLDAIRQSGGTALAVSDDDILRATDLAGAKEGIWLAPEGAATVAAIERLRDQGRVRADERIVLFNTGAGMLYPDLQSSELPRAEIPR